MPSLSRALSYSHLYLGRPYIIECQATILIEWKAIHRNGAIQLAMVHWNILSSVAATNECLS